MGYGQITCRYHPCQKSTMMLDMHEENVSEFVSQLLHSAGVAHEFHFSSPTLGVHKAMEYYYEAIPDAVDDFAEAYMGKFGQLKKFPTEYHSGEDPLEYMNSLAGFVEESRQLLPQDSYIQNEVDGIVKIIYKTIYMLRDIK
jgi:hypothetical protein